MKTFFQNCLLIAIVATILHPAIAQAPSDPAPIDPSTSFFMGRIKYSKNNGNDCSGVGQNLTKLVAEVSTIRIGNEERIAFTDPQLFETPFLFMNGHNDFVLARRRTRESAYLPRARRVFVCLRLLHQSRVSASLAT